MLFAGLLAWFEQMRRRGMLRLHVRCRSGWRRDVRSLHMRRRLRHWMRSFDMRCGRWRCYMWRFDMRCHLLRFDMLRMHRLRLRRRMT